MIWRVASWLWSLSETLNNGHYRCRVNVTSWVRREKVAVVVDNAMAGRQPRPCQALAARLLQPPQKQPPKIGLVTIDRPGKGFPEAP